MQATPFPLKILHENVMRAKKFANSIIHLLVEMVLIILEVYLTIY